MIITLYPTDDYLSKEYDGFAEGEFNMDEISILVSRHSEELVVKFGETFEIPKDFYADIEDDNADYFDYEDELRMDPLRRLEAGMYKLERKKDNYGHNINLVSKVKSIWYDDF